MADKGILERKMRPRRIPSLPKPKARPNLVPEDFPDARDQLAEIFGYPPRPPTATATTNLNPTCPRVTVIPVAEEKFDRLESTVTLEKDYDYLKGPPEVSKSAHSSEISSSDGEDEKVKVNNKTYLIPRNDKTMPIRFDGHYRGENPNFLLTGPPDIEAQGIWSGEKKFKDADAGSDSEIEPEIGEYIAALKAKRKTGESMTGETFWFDDERSIVRNLHVNSVSLTSYGDNDQMIFGRADILHPTLTPSERQMLGIRSSIQGPSSTSTSVPLPRVYSKKSNLGLNAQPSQSQLDGGMGDGFYPSLVAETPSNLK